MIANNDRPNADLSTALQGAEAPRAMPGGDTRTVLFCNSGTEANVPALPAARAATALIRQHADDLTAVLVEPTIGSGGRVPADREFLETRRSILLSAP